MITMIFETKRLILRELTMEDVDCLYKILSDKETMNHYPKPFSRRKVMDWIEWNSENYQVFGFGLWAVILKETGELIGDCGITMQKINGKIKPELGFHLNKNYWRKGYGSEAAKRCRDYLFEQTPFNALYSYMSASNLASYRTALSTGMSEIESYEDESKQLTLVCQITRKEWEKLV